MKGLVFTEFLDFVAALRGGDMVDDVIDDCRLPNGGAYTAVGTYDHAEMQALIAALAEGLMLGAADYFREPIGVMQERYEDPNGGFVRFTIRHAR